MPTEVITTVKPAGGGDYVSLDAWNIGEAKDLVAADEIATAEIYSGGNALAAAININSFTTDTTRFIRLTVPLAERHQAEWSTGKAYASASHLTGAIQCNLDIEFIGLQVENTATGSVGDQSSISMQSTSGSIQRRLVVDSCFVRKPDSATNTGIQQPALFFRQATASTTVLIKNSIIMQNDTEAGFHRYAIYSHISVCEVSILNCTIVCRGAHASSSGFISAGTLASLDIKNTYIQHAIADRALNSAPTASSYVDFFSSGTETDATTENVAFDTVNFTGVTVDAEILRISTASALFDAGTDLTSDGITTDVIGTARPQFSSFDVGAWENEVPVCWNFTAPYKGSMRTFKLSGPGAYPGSLSVPGNVDTSKGKMIDNGDLIDPDNYEVN